VVEPLVSKQWFVKMEPLAKPALRAVETGEIKILPERFEKVRQPSMSAQDLCSARV
jgi:valyl-tRNA synthetase